jgi:hypothetical protein
VCLAGLTERSVMKGAYPSCCTAVRMRRPITLTVA